jgi:S-formylglutathione hydrolase FrmB
MTTRRLHCLAAGVILLVVPACLCAGTVRSGMFFSRLLNRNMTYNVYLPTGYDSLQRAGKRFPVVYLLHGLSGTADAWHLINGPNNPEVDKIIDSVSFIAVAPSDQIADSWWMDSPILTNQKYSSYLSTEFKGLIDSLYATLPDRDHTGLAGVSMGGYGALHNLMLFPHEYCAGFGMLPAVSFLDTAWRNLMSLPTVLGDYKEYPQNWANEDILSNCSRFKGLEVSIAFYTTEADFFNKDIVNLDSTLVALGIPHECTIFKTGAHNYPTPDRMLFVLRWFDGLFTASTNRVTRPGAYAAANGQYKNRYCLRLNTARCGRGPSIYIYDDVKGEAWSVSGRKIIK